MYRPVPNFGSSRTETRSSKSPPRSSGTGFVRESHRNIREGTGTRKLIRKRLARTVLIFTERSDQLSRATDRVPGLPASPGYAQ
ncbi:hypothetical protein AA437_004860 [Salmonella enterica subsp. enterica]|nr:hypothetical protein [Salmonella enterica subsp. enterica]